MCFVFQRKHKGSKYHIKRFSIQKLTWDSNKHILSRSQIFAPFWRLLVRFQSLRLLHNLLSSTKCNACSTAGSIHAGTTSSGARYAGLKKLSCTSISQEQSIRSFSGRWKVLQTPNKAPWLSTPLQIRIQGLWYLLNWTDLFPEVWLDPNLNKHREKGLRYKNSITQDAENDKA